MTLGWLAGLVRRQAWRVIGPAIGVAAAVALLATLGSFLAHARATMTDRAVRSVSVDWQIQVTPGTDPAKIAASAGRLSAAAEVSRVGFTAVPGLSARIGGTSLSTGSGVVLGLPDNYQSSFPGQVRVLSGSGRGVLLAQQTAANLHASPGSRLDIARPGLGPVNVRVAGVVDLPRIDTLFQKVGAPAGSQPTAPPDNVVLLPEAQYNAFSGPLVTVRPDLVTTQVHVRLRHRLPSDPAAAYNAATGAAHNFEAASTGGAVVGNNLAAALDAARGDAAYAQVLFLFLGLPGAVLAGMITATVAAAAGGRRRREQALLRTRGASIRQLERLVLAEAGAVGLIGCVAGLSAAAVIGHAAFGSARFGATAADAVLWGALAAVAGLVVTGAAVLLPARRAARGRTANESAQVIDTLRRPWWARYGLDIVALVGAGAVFAATSRNGYQLVLAPEGTPTISVSYWALAGPALFWLGAGLLVWRVVDFVLGRGRPVLSVLLRPIGGRVAPLLASSMSRQRRPLVKASVLLALAIAFAISTSTFAATYRTQAEADAQLTNGADVTVTESPGVTVGSSAGQRFARIPGVHSVEPLQHRYAYVGADLQDLYGVRPDTIRSTTALQDGYFIGASATALMNTLRSHPDSILVSSETVKDYQLHLGDRITLRMIDGKSHQLRSVNFHYVGIVAEFPTAPKDSFFVTNAAYVTQQTGSNAVSTFLLNTGGTNTSAIAARARAVAGPSVAVSDISSVRGAIGSSLTSVDLSGLRRVELGFAVVFVIATAGLVFAIGLTERRRNLAIMRVLGASRRQLRAAVIAETIVLGVAGSVGGLVLGGVLTQMLVKVLTGVFDPPPSALTLPLGYLLGIAATVLACLVAVSALTQRVARRSGLAPIRGG